MCIFTITDEVTAVLKLDNQVVGQTAWKPTSQQCWDHRVSFELDRVSCILYNLFHYSTLDNLLHFTAYYIMLYGHTVPMHPIKK